MSYYDHASHLALRLDHWDMRGANGSADEDLARDIHIGCMREMRQTRQRSGRLSLWIRHLISGGSAVTASR